MGIRLKDFKDKIILDVKDATNKKKVIVTVNNESRIRFENYVHFFEELRDYYLERIDNSESYRVKKSIAFDAMHSFSAYQDLFDVYNDRDKLISDISYHESYFSRLYDAFKERDILPITTGESKYPNVFLPNRGGLEYFKAILIHLNKIQDGKLADGAFTVIDAIRKYEASIKAIHFDKKLMKPNVTVENIVNFLNDEFDAKIKYHPKFKFASNTLSQDGYVEAYYNKYL